MTYRSSYIGPCCFREVPNSGGCGSLMISIYRLQLEVGLHGYSSRRQDPEQGTENCQIFQVKSFDSRIKCLMLVSVLNFGLYTLDSDAQQDTSQAVLCLAPCTADNIFSSHLQVVDATI
jgi:hypothetical protein